VIVTSANQLIRAKIADAIFDAAADAVVACDRAGIITFWNAGAARIFGHSADEALGQSLDLIIPERLRARHWDGFHAMMESGASRYSVGRMLSVPGQRKDGAMLSVEFTIVAVKDDAGQITDLVSVMRDATERFEELKRLRKLAAR
jgi:PAS domain S-box-containing protein